MNLLPRFVEEAGGGDFAGPARTRRLAEVDNRVVGELRCLEGIGAVGFVAKIDTAVQDDVALLRAEGIREDEDGGVVRGVVGLALKVRLCASHVSGSFCARGFWR